MVHVAFFVRYLVMFENKLWHMEISGGSRISRMRGTPTPKVRLESIITKFAKVMFLHVSVILSTGGCLLLGGCLLQGGCLVQGVPGPRGVSTPGTVPGPGGVCSGGHALRQTPPPGETATAADGTHPTGMHSCLDYLVKHVPKTTWKWKKLNPRGGAQVLTNRNFSLGSTRVSCWFCHDKKHC